MSVAMKMLALAMTPVLSEEHLRKAVLALLFMLDDLTLVGGSGGGLVEWTVWVGAWR